MKKYLLKLILGFVIFIVGIVIFTMETKNYNVNENLTAHFDIKNETFIYNLKNEKIKITNSKTDYNMYVFVDDSIGDEVKIEVDYASLLNVNADYQNFELNNNDMASIDINTKMTISGKDINDLFNLCVYSAANKTLYNYTLLKYPKVSIYVNSSNLDKVLFVGNNGKTYNPSI